MKKRNRLPLEVGIHRDIRTHIPTSQIQGRLGWYMECLASDLWQRSYRMQEGFLKRGLTQMFVERGGY